MLQIHHILLGSENIFTEIHSLNCPPYWIIEDMHVTSLVGSRKVFFLTDNDQYELKARFWQLSQISN